MVNTLNLFKSVSQVSERNSQLCYLCSVPACMFHECSSAFFSLLLPVFTLLTAITYPEREESDKLNSAVIGQLAYDTADRHKGDRQEERLLHIKQRSKDVMVPALCKSASAT